MWTNLLMGLVYFFFFVWCMYYPGNNYAWNMGGYDKISYSTKVDGTNRYGDFMANLKRIRSGGTYNISSHAGSRSCNNYYYACDTTYVPATTRGCKHNLLLSWG